MQERKGRQGRGRVGGNAREEREARERQGRRECKRGKGEGMNERQGMQFLRTKYHKKGN